MNKVSAGIHDTEATAARMGATAGDRTTVAAVPLALVAIGAGLLVSGITVILLPATADVAIAAIRSLSTGARATEPVWYGVSISAIGIIVTLAKHLMKTGHGKD